ncbi:MAG: TolC family protein, partial [Pseudomonadales bacterium]|nr:TolC family protein [Pseudomonadales bacterium]
MSSFSFSLLLLFRMLRPQLGWRVLAIVIAAFPALAAAQNAADEAPLQEPPIILDERPKTAADSVIDDNNLAGIYQLAVANDLTVAQARAQLRVDNQQRWIALAGLLPSSDLQYSTSENDSDSSGVTLTGAVPQPNNTKTIRKTDAFTLSLSQQVLNVSAWFDLFQGLVQSRQAEVQFQIALQDLLQRTVDAYVAVIRARANLQASIAQGEAWERQLEQINERFDVGLVPITDVLDAQASYDLSAAQIISDEGALETAREQLTVITGQPVAGSLWGLSEDFPVRIPEPQDGNQWVNFAEANNLEIRLADYGVRVARLGARSATFARLPTISLSFSVSDSESDSDQTNFQTGLRRTTPNDSETDNLSLTASVPVFTGGSI